MITDDEKWMRRALALAKRAEDLGEIPVGAVIVRNDELIGEGWNQPISNHDCSAHAEITALRNAGNSLANYRLPGATLYVTIEPCAMCAGAMIHSRIERLVYGAPEPKSGVAVSNLNFFAQPFLNHRINVTAGVLANECSEMISAFFQARRLSAKSKSGLDK